MLEHGGRLRQAASRYGIPLADWLDLSTGINPIGYPAPPTPADAWRRLPEDDDGLEAAAAAFYGTAELLPVAGSQAAIQALPAVVAGRRVTLLDPSYAEHARAWTGRRVRTCAPEAIESCLPYTDVLVLVNPNNPTGTRFARSRLLQWHATLAARGGWLIVDEAFADPAPGDSLAPQAGRPNLVILRSLGKFFGLAGARVGFVLAEASLRVRLAERLGPWTVSGPARHAARVALADTRWQAEVRERLAHDGLRLARLLEASGLGTPSGSALFQYVEHPRAAEIHDKLARHGILARLFDTPPALRFGLPGREGDWVRLATALTEIGRQTG